MGFEGADPGGPAPPGMVLEGLDLGVLDLACVEVEGLDAVGRRRLFGELERVRRKVEAALVTVIGVADRAGDHVVDGHRTVSGWCRALGRWSPAEATQRVRAANLARVDDRFDEAMRAGRIGVAQAQLLGKAFANPRCGEQLVEVMEIMLRHAAAMPFTDFRRVVEHWERLADLDGAHREADAVHRDRHARVRATGDRVELDASGGTGTGALMVEVFDRFCRAEFLTDWETNRELHGEAATAATMPRTARQRRYDALVAIFERAASAPVDGPLPEPVVNVHVDAHTLDVMLNGEHATTPAPADPRDRRCETSAGVPLVPVDVLSACWWGRIRRVVTDIDGVVIDLGRSARLFTGAAREAVMMQATHCVMAGCTVPVADCQADHIDEWHHDGCTDCRNGCPLCGFHNRLKTARGFTVRRDHHGYWHTYRPDGTEITDQLAA